METVNSLTESDNILEESDKKSKWRNLLAFWLLGLCNNFSYVIMLSAAHDILHETWPGNKNKTFNSIMNSDNVTRECNLVSTSTILLADVVPSLIIKVFMPYFVLNIHIKMIFIIMVTVASLLMVALSTALWQAYLGVILTSIASGLGELSFLSYSSTFHVNVISTWSSGTGAAGILGALSYAGLTSLWVSSRTTILIMLSIPVIMGMTFWLLLKHPENIRDSFMEHQKILNVWVYFKEIPFLLKYMVPLFIVYFSEYFINQGLMELIYFPNIWLTLKEQYRWYQADYQLGVFISRSSVNILHIKKKWTMALLQAVNAMFCLFVAIYWFIPNIFIIFALVFYEGLLGGAVYVNTFYQMHNEVEESKKNFALAVTSASDATGIVLAGLLAIPVHNAICNLPPP